VLACVPAAGVAAGPALAAEVSERVARDLGRSFRPERVLFVDDLPKTRNLKIMRRAVRAAITGEPPGDTSSLLNAEAVDAIRAVAAAKP
jgi:acetyl-CoA synthetase